MSRAIPLALAISSAALLLSALPLESVARAQSHDEISATAQRLAREVPCIRTQQERLTSTLRLLEEAERQVRSGASGDAARRDAVHSAEALELRLGVIVGELRACLGQGGPSASGTSASATGTTGASGTTGTAGTTAGSTPRVIVRHEGESGAPHPAETTNPATQVIDSNRALRPNVFLVQAEQVDGLGRADNGDVRNAVTTIAPQFEACYDQLSTRSARQQGRVYLTFTVTPEGRVRDIRLENFTIFDRAFQRCVGAAAGHLRVREPATGGSARFSFHLRFGPPPDHGTPIPD